LCTEKQKLRDIFFNSHWLNINKEVGYWKLVVCIKVIEFKYSDRCLCKIKWKWGNRTKKKHKSLKRRTKNYFKYGRIGFI
jgi:hypothetical protein